MAEKTDNVVKGLTKKALHEMLTDLKNLKGDVSSTNGKLRNELKQHLENTGLHPKAVAIVRQLDEMTDTARPDVLRSLHAMLDLLEGARWKDRQGDFLDDAAKKEKEAEKK